MTPLDGLKISKIKAEKLVKFDILSFYPSITRKVLMKAINWAKEFTEIKDIEIATILNARNTFLFKNNQNWVKKQEMKKKISM